jgi:RimJ/RimL family protein N-acetyltransferase
MLELRALDRAHVDQARAWRNSWGIWQWTRQNDVISDWEQDRWYERQAADPSVRMYAVVARLPGEDRFVGVAGLTSIDWPNSRAEFSLYVGPEHQRSGYGRVALRCLLAHGFDNLGLRQIWGETFDGNPALKLFGALGFQLDGKRREFYWKDGRWLDAYMISLLASEWREKNGNGKGLRAPPPAAGDAAAPVAAPPEASPRRRRRSRALAVVPPPAAGAAAASPDGPVAPA